MTGTSFRLILIRALWPGYTILFEETEVQRRQVSWPRAHSYWVAESRTTTRSVWETRISSHWRVSGQGRLLLTEVRVCSAFKSWFYESHQYKSYKEWEEQGLWLAFPGSLINISGHVLWHRSQWLRSFIIAWTSFLGAREPWDRKSGVGMAYPHLSFCRCPDSHAEWILRQYL